MHPGRVTEFGRSITGKAGFLSSTKVQTARAKVDVRIVDVKRRSAIPRFGSRPRGSIVPRFGPIS
jgi:hypothetical protein